MGNKPLLIVCNKIDVMHLEELSKEKMLCMSTRTGVGVMKVKEIACDKLLNNRLSLKIKSKMIQTVLNRIYLAKPLSLTHYRSPHVPENLKDMRDNRLVHSKCKAEINKTGNTFI